MNEQSYQTTDGDPVSLWTLVRLEPDWAVSRIRETERLEAENRKLRMQYAGAMGTLSELSGHYALNHRLDREEARERLHATAKDWCELSGWTFRIVGNKLCLDPPPVKQPDIKGDS